MKPTYLAVTRVTPIQNTSVLAFTLDRQFVTNREAIIRLKHLIDGVFDPKEILN